MKKHSCNYSDNINICHVCDNFKVQARSLQTGDVVDGVRVLTVSEHNRVFPKEIL